MAVGDISASGGIRIAGRNDRSAQIRAASTQGLGDAITGAGQAIGQYANSKLGWELAAKDRVDAYNAMEAATDFLAFQSTRAERATEFQRARGENPLGMAAAYDAEEKKQEEQFLATIKKRDPLLYDEYRNKTERDRINRGASMLVSEFAFLDAKENTKLGDSLNLLGTSLKNRQVSMEDAIVQFNEFVDKSGLAATDKELHKRNAKTTLQTLAFGTEVEEIQAGRGARKLQPGQKDVVAAGLNPFQRGVLNAISSKEASDYNILNGGGTFDSYDDHPRRKGPGGTSTAAGKYQFVEGTWDNATASYYRTYGVRVPNFSPEWQDRVALHWAEQNFNRHNKLGLTFQQVMDNPTFENMRALRSTIGDPKVQGNPHSVEWAGWTSQAGADRIKKDAEFFNLVTGQSGLAGGGTGTANGLDVWSDPRFADMPLEDKLRMSATASTAIDAQRRAEAEALKAAADAFKKSAYDLAYQTPDLTVLDQLRTDPRFTPEVEEEFNKGYSAGQQRIVTTNQISDMLKSGQPLTAANDKHANTWFGEKDTLGLQHGDDTALARAAFMAQQGKRLSSAVVDSLRIGLNNPEAQAKIMDFLAQLHTGDPTIIDRSGFTSEDLTDVLLYKTIAARSPDATTTSQLFTAMKEGRNLLGKTQVQINKETSDYFTENIGVDRLTSILDPSGLGNKPSLPSDTLKKNKLHLDALTAFRDGYMIYGGDTDAAETYMNNHLKKTWGGSWAGGSNGELMKLPPEQVFTHIDHQSIVLDAHARQEVMSYLGEIGVPYDPASRVQIITDRTTEQEHRDGKIPTYALVTTGPDGSLIALPNRWGGEDVETFLAGFAEARAMEKATINNRKAVRAAREEEVFEQLANSGDLTINDEVIDEGRRLVIADSAASRMVYPAPERPQVLEQFGGSVSNMANELKGDTRLNWQMRARTAELLRYGDGGVYEQLTEAEAMRISLIDMIEERYYPEDRFTAERLADELIPLMGD